MYFSLIFYMTVYQLVMQTVVCLCGVGRHMDLQSDAQNSVTTQSLL